MALGLVGKLTVMFGADFKGFDKAIKNATTKLDRFSRNANRLGNQLSTNLTLPILAVGAGAIKLASDFEESLNKVNVSFGESSKEVQTFAKTTIDNFGIAEGSALEMASLFGDLSTSIGFTQKSAADMSVELVGLAGDLASFKNVQIDVAQTALKGIFTGETEALKNLGINVTENVLRQSEFFKALGKNFNQLTLLEKTQIRFNEVIKQSSNAIGDYKRTQDGVANSTRNLQESVKELGEQFGKELLPLASDVIKTLKGVVDRMRSMSDENKKLAINIALVTAALGPLIKALASLSTLIKNLIIFIPKLYAVLMGPVGLIAGFVALFIKLDEGDGIISNLKKGFNQLKTAIFGVNEEAKKLDTSLMEKIGATDPSDIRKRMMGAFGSGTKFGDFDLGKPKPKPKPKGTMMAPMDLLPLQKLNVELDKLPEKLKNVEAPLRKMTQAQKELNAATQLFGDVMFNAMMDAANSQEGFFSSFVENMKKAIKQLLIQLAVMTAINILLGGKGMTLGKAFSAAKTSILGLQSGGLVTGPTMALVGEGAGTNASNPEVVAPLDKLKGMINGSNGSQQIEVFGRISGNDIFISNQRGGLGRLRSV
jgi:hypothetical protein